MTVVYAKKRYRENRWQDEKGKNGKWTAESSLAKKVDIIKSTGKNLPFEVITERERERERERESERERVSE